MDVSALIADLTERRKQYQGQAATSKDPDYWAGKASGLLLAVEIITAQVAWVKAQEAAASTHTSDGHRHQAHDEPGRHDRLRE